MPSSAILIGASPYGRPWHGRQRDGAGTQGCSDARHAPRAEGARQLLRRRRQGLNRHEVELGDLGPGGHIAVNQMYVRYMVPQGGDGNLPVVMVHGATLTGKSWETTPDGRMGWDEYFVRKGHPVYVPDQVGRGRSGFNQAVFNNVRAGSTPAASLPALAAIQRRESSGRTSASARSPAPPTRTASSRWPPWTNSSKQGVPDVSFGGTAHTQPHAQGVVGSRQPAEWRGVDGTLAIRARFRWRRRCSIPPRRKGLVLVEPGGCPGELHRRTDQDAGERSRFWSSSVITATRRPALDPALVADCRSRAVRH